MGLRKLNFTLTLVAALMLSLAPAGSATAAQDVRVVVDISGSMKLNDPDNLRRPAVRLLARLLPNGTAVGLWTFGREVNMLVPHGALGDDQRQALIAGSSGINSVAQRTNIGGAIETASDPWFSPQQSLTNTHLILLSDGKVDIDTSPATNNAERERILSELVPRLAAQGLTIHTIALSAEADLDLLGAIADLTGGVAHVAGTADELSRIFADTLGQAVPANELPLANNRFMVDSEVEEFTALIFSDTPPESRQLALVDPNGKRSSAGNTGVDFRWAREPGYDLITVTWPKAGEWQLVGTLGEGSRVTVVSDLQLEVRPIPPRFEAGEAPELEAFFSEAGEPITDEDFLSVITVRLTLTAEDGRQGARVLNEGQPPADGIYRDSFGGLTGPGQYQLELTADGGTFSRKFRQTLAVLAPEGGDPIISETLPSQPEPEVAPEPAPEIESPIDLSLVEEPAPTTDAADTASAEPTAPSRSLWLWLGAGVGVVLLMVLGLVMWRRRSQAVTVEPEPEPQSATAEGDPETPVSVAPATGTEDAFTDAIDVPPGEDEQSSVLSFADPFTDPGADPVADEKVQSDEPPESQPDGAVGDLEKSLPQEDNSDEFGLEDFDLSDLDNLPDLDTDQASQGDDRDESIDGQKRPGRRDNRRD